MSVLEEYEKAKAALFEHVGLTPDWVEYAIEPMSEHYWSIGNEDGHVRYADTLEKFHSDGGYWEDEIYTQRFYQQHLYEGPEFTLIFCDPHVDGCKWFRVFDNSKRL